MTVMPNPVLLAALGRERQARLLAGATMRDEPRTAVRARVRIGRALIGLGAMLTGDRVERRPRHPATAHPA